MCACVCVSNYMYVALPLSLFPPPTHLTSAGVGGIGALFGYSSPLVHNMSLHEAVQSSTRSAFEAPKLTATTVGANTTPHTSTSSVANGTSNSSVGAANGSRGFPGSNSIDWPDLASSNVSAVGAKRTGKTGSSSAGSVGAVLNSNVATWNGSLGNGVTAGNGSTGNGTGKETAAVSSASTTGRSKGRTYSSG